MKKTLLTVGMLLIVFTIYISCCAAGSSAENVVPVKMSSGDYVIIGWNDLGMHCINPSFKDLAILPPFNNLWAQVIKRGDPPVIVTSGISLEYSVNNNTKVSGKTDFWQYAEQLFGVKLQEGTGLTGNGLSGTMQMVNDHFEATGIPLLPYDDRMNWNPYQIATVKMRTAAGGTPRKIEVVLPVSDELDCAQCHAQGMDATVNLKDGGSESVDMNILAVHDYYHGAAGTTSTGPNLMDKRPVLCASCHADNALGAKGDGSSMPLSRAMHGWHAKYADAGCYSCHPGQITQCLRTGIGGMGYLGDTPSCQTGLCHGGMQQVADSIGQGREPWLQEPSCEMCHGSNTATGQDLYRNAKGHGGLYCAACHNSPHVWWPSKMWADNLQSAKLQHAPTAIGDCSVCHTRKMEGRNPHVTYYPVSGGSGK